ncbi:hypothetical protein ACVME8_009548 [Bradyrhizobium diazoefficiens]
MWAVDNRIRSAVSSVGAHDPSTLRQTRSAFLVVERQSHPDSADPKTWKSTAFVSDQMSSGGPERRRVLRIEAESGSGSPSEIAEQLARSRGFQFVFPGLVSSDEGEPSFADYREVIIGFRQSTAIGRARFAKLHNLTSLQFDQVLQIGVFRAQQAILPSIFQVLAEDQDILFAEPAYLGSVDDIAYRSGRTENEATVNFEDYWAHQLTGVAEIQLPQPGRGVTVAILDNAVDLSHPDIVQASLTSKPLDFTVKVGPVFYGDHGTQCAGIVVSKKSTSAGHVLGIAPLASLIGMTVTLSDADSYMSRIKALGACLELAKSGYRISESKVIRAERLVVNCSWQIIVRPVPIAIQEAFSRIVQEENVVVVCSAGNDTARGKPHYPSDFDGVLSVTAVQETDIVAAYANVNLRVDLCAPGGNTKINDGRGGIITAVPGGGYAYDEGTSFATPYAAGLIALLWSENPNASAAQIRDKIRDCTVSISDQNPSLKELLRAGRIDARRVASSGA